MARANLQRAWKRVKANKGKPGVLPVGHALASDELDHIVLRKLHTGDLDAFLAYRTDPLVARFQGWELDDAPAGDEHRQWHSQAASPGAIAAPIPADETVYRSRWTMPSTNPATIWVNTAALASRVKKSSTWTICRWRESAANRRCAVNGISLGLRYPGQYAEAGGVNYNYFRDYEPRRIAIHGWMRATGWYVRPMDLSLV
jgi:hypothetical protein